MEVISEGDTTNGPHHLAGAHYQRHLDAASKLVISGQAEAFTDHVVLPYVFRTAAGEEVAETAEELIEDIRKIHEWLRSQQATDYYRIVHKARFLDEETIDGTHVSYVLRGAIPVNAPYRSRMILRCVDGHWRAAYSEHELADALFPARDARPRPGIFLTADEFGTEPVFHDTARALPIYQATIDAISYLFKEKDFEAWMKHFTNPYDIHYEGNDFYATTPQASRPFFDALVDQMAETGATAVVREANFAAFLSPDRIMGYHVTTLRDDEKTCFGPIRSRMIIKHIDGSWKCCSVTNSLSNAEKVGAPFKLSDHLPTLREIQQRKSK